MIPNPFPKTTSIDGYPTPTSIEQQQTEHILAAHRPAAHGQANYDDGNNSSGNVNDDSGTKSGGNGGGTSSNRPTLHRNLHLQWLARNFSQGFPPRFVSQDASQPWLFFWTIQSFTALGAELDPVNRQRCIDTIMACQHPEGGFGGGPGQFPHLLPTYAAISALSIVGRPGPNGGWDQVNREKLYSFFLSLKQPDGSFLVSKDSEVDIRGIYCLLCVATILNLLTPELIAGTARFIKSLQTYEGGFASASHPYYASSTSGEDSLLDYPRPAMGEAHGGYTYCALASWVMLRPLIDVDSEKSGRAPLEIDVKNLTRWLVNMQGNRNELGGFRGRTNKLVDACYGWWVGGCFPLMRALGVGGLYHQHQHHSGSNHVETANEAQGDDEEWTDLDDELFDRTGLQEYLLYAAQHPMGGLRDKPPKPADSYHTLYSLSGLSTAQHNVSPSQELKDKLLAEWKPLGDGVNPGLEKIKRTAYIEARSWKEDEGSSVYVGGAGNRVNATHPVFNLTITHWDLDVVYTHPQAFEEFSVRS